MMSFLLSILTALSFASAQETFPTEVKVGDKTLKKMGVGTRKATIFKVKVYEAGLFVEDPATFDRNDDTVKFVRMKFLRNVDADDVKDVYREALPKSCGGDCKLDFNPLLNNIKEAKKNEIHEFTLYPDRVIIDQAGKKDEYKQAGLAKVVLGMWVGDHPPNPELKSGMLGK